MPFDQPFLQERIFTTLADGRPASMCGRISSTAWAVFSYTPDPLMPVWQAFPKSALVEPPTFLNAAAPGVSTMDDYLQRLWRACFCLNEGETGRRCA